MFKLKFLMGASALVAAAAGLTSPVAAQVTTQIYGGGSSLVGPYLRQAEDCYGNPTPLLIESTAVPPGDATLANPPIPFFNYTGANPQNCATTHIDASVQLNYISAGSGNGIRALYSHTPTPFWGTQPDGTPFPYVTNANAETALAAADVTVYNSGGTEQGQTFGPPPATYPIPQPLYGNLIQYPLLITPIDIAYDSVYKKLRMGDGSIKSYHFHVQNPRSNRSGGLVLDATTYCKIFNGQITNWNDPALEALNGGVSLQDPTDHGTFSVPLTMVGRSDSSGTTSVWTRHLAAQCASLITGNQYPDFSTTLPAALQGPVWNKSNPNFGAGSGVTDVPGKYTLAAGSDGVADYIQFDAANVPSSTKGAFVIQGRMGYVGPDFVLPSVANTGNNTFGLQSASLLRPGGSAPISPTAKTAALAYDALSGITVPSGSDRSHPDLWVQPPNKTAPIAIPADPAAYPIDGTSNVLLYTCYANPGVTSKLLGFLGFYETSKVVNDAAKGLLGKAGFAPMPKAWVSAINTTFISPVAATRPLSLFIRQAGTGPATGNGSQCHAIMPGA